MRHNTSLSFHHAFPRSYAGRQRIGEAAGRSLFPCVSQVDADAMVWLHSPHGSYGQPTYLPIFGCRWHTSPATSSAFRLLSRVGEGDISALRCGLTGSCSSTFQYYSLGNHLGVTASPQSPLLAGYVTLPVDSRSPPLGLMSPRSRGQANLHILLSLLHSSHMPPRLGRGAPYVKSETQSLFGAGALNWRFTRSSGLGADLSGIVVRIGLPRIMP